jgi:Holliday junction resolvase RusA-like endonuclease
MTYRVVITNANGTFPIKGLNELLGGRMYDFRTKKYRNPVKSANDAICARAIRKYMRGVKIDKPIQCTFWIYAQDKMHDRGNLSSACEKSFLDALQQAKVISNDGFDDVLDSIFHTAVDRHNPHIEVEIEVIE